MPSFIVNTERQKKERILFTIACNMKWDIDQVIDKLKKAKKRGANLMEYGYYPNKIAFFKETFETDKEYNARIKQEQEFIDEMEQKALVSRKEAYIRLKAEFEEGKI